MQSNHQEAHLRGITCPNCGGFIPTSIFELLTAHCLSCPCCLLQLHIDRRQSEQAMNALKKVEQARKRLEERSHFSR